MRALRVAVACAAVAAAGLVARTDAAAPRPRLVRTAPARRAQPGRNERERALDRRVKAFLERRAGTWHDLNVPPEDGRTLHDLVVTRRLTRAVEIGTSTGHSAIWIAWALSKTGGRLTTIDVDPIRHREALANFEEAGLSRYIDARLGDAHEIVPRLKGPLDFVFSDADKEWYTRYLDALWPELAPGGCFTAHNVTMRMAGIRRFLAALDRLRDGKTTIDRSSPAGLSITCKLGGRGL